MGAISAVSGGADLALRWGDGSDVRLPWSWLRDACPCDGCRASGGRQRTLDLSALTFPPRIPEVSLSPVDLSLTWPEGAGTHVSRWPLDHLRRVVAAGASAGIAHRDPRRSADPDGSGRMFRLSPLRRRAWDEMIASERALEDVLAGVDEDGAALISGVPTQPGAVLDVVATFGYVRTTNYGELFDVRPETDPTNLANSAAGLGPHTDNPYRDPPPSIQVLHCLRSSAVGGDTVLIDGFAAVRRLDGIDPSAGRLLRRWPLRWVWRDASTELEAVAPVIEESLGGLLRQVRFNERSRAPLIAPADVVTELLAALIRFAAVLADPEGQTIVPLRPGDVVIMDNRRVLHARTAFQSAGERWLQGCYSDIDGLRSRLAVLRRHG